MRLNRILFILLVIVVGIILYPRKIYDASDFQIEIIHSNMDCNQNGIDDYTDILLGARKEALNKVKYKSAYYAGGYPPDDEGVCTDLIWRAIQNAGYSLKDMVDNDIKNKNYYEITTIDPNIDFRRVENLIVYFEHNHLSLSTNPYEIASFQPGDIVTFGKKHIAVISDKRNKKGIPYLIHNAGQLFKREDDTLLKWYKKYGISGHFRFNETSCEKVG